MLKKTYWATFNYFKKKFNSYKSEKENLSQFFYKKT